MNETEERNVYIINVGTTRVAYCEAFDKQILQTIIGLSAKYENGVLVESGQEPHGLTAVGNITVEEAFRTAPTTKVTKGRKTLLDALNAYAPTIKGENKFVLVSQHQAIMTVGWNNKENSWEDVAIAHTPYGQIFFSIVEENSEIKIVSHNIFESVLVCSFLRSCGIVAKPQAL